MCDWQHTCKNLCFYPINMELFWWPFLLTCSSPVEQTSFPFQLDWKLKLVIFVAVPGDKTVIAGKTRLSSMSICLKWGRSSTYISKDSSTGLCYDEYFDHFLMISAGASFFPSHPTASGVCWGGWWAWNGNGAASRDQRHPQVFTTMFLCFLRMTLLLSS